MPEAIISSWQSCPDESCPVETAVPGSALEGGELMAPVPCAAGFLTWLWRGASPCCPRQLGSCRCSTWTAKAAIHEEDGGFLAWLGEVFLEKKRRTTPKHDLAIARQRMKRCKND